MGGINKHPSCKSSWEMTTRVSMAVSSALAMAFEANTHLERVILAEFDESTDLMSASFMLEAIDKSAKNINEARNQLASAIELGMNNPTPHSEEFSQLSPNLLAELWDGKLLTACKQEVRSLAEEIRAQISLNTPGKRSILLARERDTVIFAPLSKIMRSPCRPLSPNCTQPGCSS